jgi:uncharacterized protein (TIRG00374 family)
VNKTLNADGMGNSGWTSVRSVLIGFLFGGVFLALAFRETSYQGFGETLRTANSAHIFVGIGFYALYLVARTSRWSLLLAKRTTTRPFPVLFRATTWGTAANSIIPHSGEILRTFAVNKPLKITAASVLGAIAAERLYDFATVIILTVITLLFIKEPPIILQSALLTICAMGAGALVVLALLAFRVPLVVGMVDLMTRILPKRFEGAAHRLVNELSVGIRAAFSNPHLTWIGILSLIQWLCIAMCIYLSIEAFGLGLSPWIALIVLPLTIAGLTLPTAPVYLGTIQVCFLAGLVPFEVSNEVAIAASAAYISIITLPVVAVSFVWYLVYVLTQKKAL